MIFSLPTRARPHKVGVTPPAKALSVMPSISDHPSTTNPDQVCVVVVTYNRKELLRECLQALLAQTRPLARILVVNNVSTDGTLEMLAEEFAVEQFPQIEVLTLPKNIGGAGGFHEGVKRAAALGSEWIWLMDDDTIPHVDALAQLLSAREGFAAERRPDLLASRVVWTDGSMHSMNVPWLNLLDVERNFEAARHATIPLRTTTFVSVLLHRRLVERYGLPIADYFIGGDDVEYTGRILKREFGVVVPTSVVLHKTPQKHGSLDVPAPKFYYYVRNTVWILTRSAAFEGMQKYKYAARFLLSLGGYLRRTVALGAGLRAIGSGLWDGLTKAPKR